MQPIGFTTGYLYGTVFDVYVAAAGNGDNTVSCTVSGLGNNCCIETYDRNVITLNPASISFFLLCTFLPNWGLIKELSEFQYILVLAIF